MQTILYIVIELLKNFFLQYQDLLGILIAAGLSFLLYMHLLRINNFFDYSKKYDEFIKTASMLFSVYVKNKQFYNQKTNQILNVQDSTAIVNILNFYVQLGIMYRLGLINRRLVLLTFGNPLIRLRTKKDLIDFAETNSSKKDISYLIKQCENSLKRRDRRNRILKLLSFRK